VAIWTVSLLSVAFVIYTPMYSTIAAACTIFMYVSYVIPTTLGLVAYGRSWKRMGPWNMGAVAYRTFSVFSILGCGLFLLVGIQPPNDKNLWIVLFVLAATGVAWLGYERRRFRGPPHAVLHRAHADWLGAPEPAAVESS
jgi:amino acid transporter